MGGGNRTQFVENDSSRKGQWVPKMSALCDVKMCHGEKISWLNKSKYHCIHTSYLFGSSQHILIFWRLNRGPVVKNHRSRLGNTRWELNKTIQGDQVKDLVSCEAWTQHSRRRIRKEENSYVGKIRKVRSTGFGCWRNVKNRQGWDGSSFQLQTG